MSAKDAANFQSCEAKPKGPKSNACLKIWAAERNQTMNALPGKTVCPDEKEPLGKMCNGFLTSPKETKASRQLNRQSHEQHLQPDPSRDGILQETFVTWLPTQLQTVGNKSNKKKNLSGSHAQKGTEIIIRRSYDNDIWVTKWTKATRKRAGALNGPEPPSATKQHESKQSIRRQQTEQTLKSAALCRVSTMLKQRRRWIHKRKKNWLFIRFASWQRGQHMQMHNVQKKHARYFWGAFFVLESRLLNKLQSV